VSVLTGRDRIRPGRDPVRPRPLPPPEPGATQTPRAPAQRTRPPRQDPAPDPRGFLDTAGAIALFSLRLLRATPGVRHYAGEAIRQAAIIVTGSTLVILVIAFFAGGSCGLESSALAQAFGAEPIGGGFSAWCTLREVVPFVFGYIVAAKVGCGMVAELSSMRVAEEVDQLDGMGVPSLTYLAGTRFVACGLTLPFVYLLAIAAAYAAAALMSLGRFAAISPGTWKLFFLTFQSPTDLLYSLIKGLLISGFVVLVALHQGYGLRARSPVDVGLATARSMAISIVGVTVISMLGTLIFWGANPRIPIG
jgi:phospholipid/cholesterol/gamma-HCH transport system permease protein